MMPHVLTRSLDRSATVFLIVVAAAGVLIPLSNLLLPAGSMFQVPTYLVALFGKYVCYAILALAIDLIWGYCGILSLGHGAFFALGGYAMGMYLMRQIGSRGVYGNSVLPDFMVFLNYPKLPWYWHGFDMFWFAALMVVLVPGLLAFGFGWLAFRSRVTGVYLSIITQAMTYALLLAFFRNDFGFGGNNGLTDFKDILGFNVQAESTLEARQGVDRDPRRRIPHAISRLPRRVLQAVRIHAVGLHGRRCRCAVCAAGRHHQSR
jgi:urea transport system permease protein